MSAGAFSYGGMVVSSGSLHSTLKWSVAVPCTSHLESGVVVQVWDIQPELVLAVLRLLGAGSGNQQQRHGDA